VASVNGILKSVQSNGANSTNMCGREGNMTSKGGVISKPRFGRGGERKMKKIQKDLGKCIPIWTKKHAKNKKIRKYTCFEKNG